MKGINKAILIGNLGAEPETRYTASGAAITNISIATSESWTDKNSGERKEKVEWHRVVFFNRLAEVAGEYLHKGSPVYIEGKIVTRKWTDDNNIDRYSTEIHAREMQMLGSKGDNQNQSNQHQEPRQGSFRDNPKQEAQSQPAQTSVQDDFAEDDIPF